MSFASLTKGIRFNAKKSKNVEKLFQPAIEEKEDTADDLDGFFEVAGPSSRAHEGDHTMQDEGQSDADTFRRLYRIKCTGDAVPSPIASFMDLEEQTFSDAVKANLKSLQFKTPTPIQCQAVPVMLKDRDLLACAPTGSGKTMAFLLPLLLQYLASAEDQRNTTSAIILEPTRELATQVYTQAKALAEGTGWKVTLLGDKKSEKSTGIPNLIITTPLRLVYAIKEGTISAASVANLVLDEGDKLFELDFLSQTDDILKACTNTKLHKSVFSATFASGMEEFAKTVMRDDFIRIIVGQKDSAASLIEQQLVFCGTEEGKLSTMRTFLRSGNLLPPVLIFVQSVERASDLCRQLEGENVKVDVIHSERTQTARDRALQGFASGQVWVLICTDVLSRGIDFQQVNVVINYDFPQTAASYIHRIGRTGRNGREGKAITYFTRDDGQHLKSIVNIMRNSGCEVPQWMLDLKTPSQLAKRKLKQRPVERKKVSQSNYPMLKNDKNSKKKPKGVKPKAKKTAEGGIV